ncbi:hypothetical protein BgAZ_502870 [Babesia gibsoni]|uniref:Uncharacterized protein n=1 Tax=Babesia gibsoni TaxID=33632 RepID=A0AAD8LR00_BABGI|nr:hypothetical protein BgAZ_502870 [Babesia gibsoni]
MYMYIIHTLLHLCLTVDAFVYRGFLGTSVSLIDEPLRSRQYTQKYRTIARTSHNGGLCAHSPRDEAEGGDLDSQEEIPAFGDGSENTTSTEDDQDEGQPDAGEEDSSMDSKIGSLMEFSRDSDTEDKASQPPGNLKISRRLWKTLMALLIYRAKYGDYMVTPTFAFSEDDEPRLTGYCLGKELNALLENIKLHDTDIALYNRLMSDPERSKKEYPTCDILEAPRLLWLIGFPTAKYLSAREQWRQEKASLRGMGSRIRRSGLIRGLGSISKEVKDETVGDRSRIEQAKKEMIDFIHEEYIHNRDKVEFNRRQELPRPSNRARVRPNLFKNIISELLEIKQTKNSRILTPRPTRNDTEGGHHYAFYHWSFEDVIECMVLFNDMYMDHNREMLIESEKRGSPFNPITFNILKPEWRVPKDDLWPERFWGLPLGIWIDKMRNGDIDAKQHWLRRDVLDYLQFDWGDGLKYLTFTWDKVVLGLIWYINLRGFPIDEMSPSLVVSNAELVAKWGKPEEIQGMKLGYVVHSALDQLQVLRKYYPQRFEFLHEMGLVQLCQEEIDLGYKPLPHQRTTAVSRYLQVSKDGKYLKD